MLIAGHLFGLNGRCSCGMTWLRLLDRRAEWQPGAHGIAHTGTLTTDEIREIEAEIDRIWECMGA